MIELIQWRLPRVKPLVVSLLAPWRKSVTRDCPCKEEAEVTLTRAIEAMASVVRHRPVVPRRAGRADAAPPLTDVRARPGYGVAISGADMYTSCTDIPTAQRLNCKFGPVDELGL